MNALHRTWEKLIFQTLTEAEQMPNAGARAFTSPQAGGGLNDPNGLCQYKASTMPFISIPPSMRRAA